MRPQVVSIAGCLMLGGLMMIPLAGILRSGARNWHRQPAFAQIAPTGGSHATAPPIAASFTSPTRSDYPASGSSSSSRASVNRPNLVPDDYALYWRTADYAYPELNAAGLRPPNGASLTAPPNASGEVFRPGSYGAPKHRIGELQDGIYVLQGANLRVTDVNSDEAIRLGATLIGGGLGTGLYLQRAGDGLYFGPFNPGNISAGTSALTATSVDADFGGIDAGALEPVTPGLTSSNLTISRNLDNVVVASSSRSPASGGAGLPSPTRYDSASPYGPAAPTRPGASSSQASGSDPTPPTVSAGESQPPIVQQPTGRPPGGGASAQPSQPGVAPAPLPAPFPQPRPAETQPPVDPLPVPVFGDMGDSPSNPPGIPPAVPRPFGGSVDPLPSNDAPAFPAADPPQSAGNATQPPAQPPVFPDFIPPLADAIASSGGALPNVPPALPAVNGDWPGNADPPWTPGFDPPVGPGGVGSSAGQVDDEFATAWLPSDFGFSAVPEPASLILLLAGLCGSAFRLPRSAIRVTQG